VSRCKPDAVVTSTVAANDLPEVKYNKAWTKNLGMHQMFSVIELKKRKIAELTKPLYIGQVVR